MDENEKIEEYHADAIEQGEAESQDIFRETAIQYNMWQNDPEFKKKYPFLTKDTVFGNLGKEDYDTIISELDIAYQCEQIHWNKTADFLMLRVASILNVTRSLGGFTVKQQGTQTLKKEIGISRDNQKKKKFLGRF